MSKPFGLISRVQGFKNNRTPKKSRANGVEIELLGSHHPVFSVKLALDQVFEIKWTKHTQVKPFGIKIRGTIQKERNTHETI